MSRQRRWTLGLAAIAVVGLVSGGIAASPPAQAAPGCTVSYTKSSEWQGGFGASVSITNLGDPVSGWTLEWSYAAGQQVGQHWNADITQSGALVTAKNVSYNGSIATGAKVEFGFNGTSTSTSTNPDPTA